jgi:YHS domain-containing protein
MTPLRLFVLAVLFYIGWMLVKGLFKRDNPVETVEGKDKQNDSEGRVEDILVEDPVCHKLVPRKQAIRFRQSGEDYYFCSEKCCDAFSTEPGGEK